MSNGALRVGFGRTDITPKLGTQLVGYGDNDRPAEEILDPLHATAMVLEQGSVKAAVINLDWCFVCEVITDRIRAEVNARTGIPPMHVAVSTTHTHSAPCTRTIKTFGRGDSDPWEYVDAVLPLIACAVEQANAALTEAEVGLATTESLTGVNRRGVDEQGRTGFMSSPHDPFDPTMTVVHFRDKEGADVGIVVHYGAHNTAMGNTRQVTRDWCGVMKDRVESQWKAPVLYLNGSEGDTGPRTNFRRSIAALGDGLSAGVGDGIHAVREVGYRAATDAIRALISIKDWRTDLRLGVHVEEILMPYAPLPPLEEAKAMVAKLELEGKKSKDYHYNKAVVEAWGKPPMDGVRFQQNAITLGPLAIIPLPGEIFSSISLRVRSGSPFQYTLLCSNTNGTRAYLTTREAKGRGGYEVTERRCFGAYVFADGIDDALVTACLKTLRSA